MNDTGGGYYEGSTDITRTFVLGSVDQQMKKYFTAVVRAMMNLSRAKFLYGCYGYNLDVLARGPIWDLDLDFQCGTGHGVGYLANVHEPPTGFRWYVVPSKNEHHKLEEGMVKKIRMKKAKSLLKGSNMTVENIALSVGYQNVEHFNRLFKKAYNMTPIQFRNEK